MIYSNRNCNYPHQIYAKWWLAVPPLGDDEGAPDYAGIPKRVLRSDIYLEANEGNGRNGEGDRGAVDHAVR